LKLLIDTHVAIWTLADDPTLEKKTRSIMNDPANACSCSVVSVWEIAIKSSLAKLEVGTPLEQIPEALAVEAGVALLGIDLAHVIETAKLPWHHRDPFDRMLIAQARHEGMTIVTRDRNFARYDVPVLAA
jgi:PIN domain nuclease of toxin-antitoxin system